METQANPIAALQQARTPQELKDAYINALNDVNAAVDAVLPRVCACGEAEAVEPALWRRANVQIDADDPTTWPTDMQAHRASHLQEGPMVTDRYHERELYELRRDALFDAVIQRLGDVYDFPNAAVAHFMESLPEGTTEHALAHRLENSVQHLVVSTIEECLELVPRLQQVLPYETPGELLAALTINMDDATDEGIEDAADTA